MDPAHEFMCSQLADYAGSGNPYDTVNVFFGHDRASQASPVDGSLAVHCSGSVTLPVYV